MSELLTISIRRKLDKGDKITTNEIRALLATVQAYKNKITELETENKELATRYVSVFDNCNKLFTRVTELEAEKVQS